MARCIEKQLALFTVLVWVAQARRAKPSTVTEVTPSSLEEGELVAELTRHAQELSSNATADEGETADAQWWREQSFKREDIAKNMVYVDCNGNSAKASGIPKDFGGLWWMDGNFAPEVVASFGQGTWFPGEEGCKGARIFHYGSDEKKKNIVKGPHKGSAQCRGRLMLPYWENRTWAFENIRGTHVFQAIDFKAEFVCGGDDPNYLTVCKVAMPADSVTNAVSKVISNTVFAFAYWMVRVNENLWVRYTPLPGGVFSHQYFLKRITDCNGAPVEPYWGQFNSNGRGKDSFSGVRDAFGSRLWRRWSVSKVSSTLMVRAKSESKNPFR